MCGLVWQLQQGQGMLSLMFYTLQHDDDGDDDDDEDDDNVN